MSQTPDPTDAKETVLKEFSRPYQSHEDVGGPDADAMADEIVRLRGLVREAFDEGQYATDRDGCPMYNWDESDARKALEGTA